MYAIRSYYDSAIYSGFATLILFLIWLYWNFLTLLIGARISFYAQHPQLLDVEGRVPVLSRRTRESKSHDCPFSWKLRPTRNMSYNFV